VPSFYGAQAGDENLVAAVRAGDDRAFEQLYQRYRRRIAAYIYGMVKDYGRSEEIAQDVFVSALRRMRNTDCEIAFKPWIYEIAKNACIDQFRRGRRAELVSYDADEGLGETDRGKLVTTSPSPDAAVAQKQSIDHLRGAFGGLSEAHHEILVMRELEGMSYRQIGERLGMTRASVESTLFRARKRLSEEYEELVSGERCLRVQAIISSMAGESLGARDQRRMARHVSYCQPCRRHAALAGLDVVALTAKPPLRTKIAAVLPLPAFLRRRWDLPGDSRDAIANSPNVSSLAQWSAQVAPAMDPAGMATWAKAAVAAATVAIAGVGANVATEKLSSDPAPDTNRPAVTKQAEQRGSQSGGGAGATSRSGAASPQAPVTAADGAPAPVTGSGQTADDPGTRSLQQGKAQAPGAGDPLDGVAKPNLGGTANPDSPGSPVPSAPPGSQLGETAKGVLSPPPKGSESDPNVGSTIQDTASSILVPNAPSDPTAPSAPGATPFGALPELPAFSAPAASASRSDGGSLLGTATDRVQRVVGSLVGS
jgi:RNA polymerase sigma factor (sigma-70 family)